MICARRLWLVLGTFSILGVATLLSWNVLLSVTEYYLVRSHVSPYAPSLADNFPTILANAYTYM